MKRIVAVLLLTGIYAVAQSSVDHVIVIFNENRSAAHFFGTFVNQNLSVSGYGAQAVGQCHATSASNPLGPCLADSDCGNTTGACLRGSALDGSMQAKTSTGSIVTVSHNPANGQDINCIHSYHQIIKDIDNGLMDKFDTGCANSSAGISNAFSYYNGLDFCNYAGGVYSNGRCSLPTLWEYAMQGVLLDHFFASFDTPSYPAHLAMWAAQSNEAVDIPLSSATNAWNCANPKTNSSPLNPPFYYQSTVGSVAYPGSSTGLPAGTYYEGGQCSTGNVNAACVCKTTTGSRASCVDSLDCGGGQTCVVAVGNVSTGCVGASKGCVCPDLPTIGDSANNAAVTWHYYAPTNPNNGETWNPVSYIQHEYFGPDWISNVSPPGKTLEDISTLVAAVNGCTTTPTCPSLAQLVWVQTGEPPNGHPISNYKKNIVQMNQSWTVSVIQAIMANPNVYDHSIIFIVYDDFGGFYDFVPPPVIDELGWGIRVAAIALGPFVQSGVSHAPYEFASILKCMENPPGAPWTLASLGQRDSNPNVTNLCDPPGNVVNGEWSTGGVIPTPTQRWLNSISGRIISDEMR